MTDVGSRVSKRTVLTFGSLLFVVALASYASLPTKDYYWDGVWFSLNIEKARGIEPFLFHPNHLLYEVAGYGAYKLAWCFGLHLRAIQVLQIVNSILGALTAVVMYSVIISFTRSLYIACWCAVLFSFSATWWRFSTDADAYIPSVLFGLIAFWWTLQPGRARPLRVGAAHAASMLFHELAVFLYPVLLLGLAFQTASCSAARRWRVLVEYMAAASLVTLSAYWWGFTAQAGHHSSRHFVRWVTYSAPDAHFSFGLWSNLTKAMRSQVRLFFGGRFSLMQKYANPLIVALVLLLFILCLVFIFSLAQYPRELLKWSQAVASPHGNFSPLWTLSLLWIAPYVLFLYFWLPGNTFYRLFYLPPSVLLLAIGLSRLRELAARRRHFKTAMFVCIVVLWNLVFYTYPYAHGTANPVVSMALHMKGVWPAGTSVYYRFFDPDDQYFAYLNPQTVWKRIDPADLAYLDRQVTRECKRGRAAWIDITAQWAMDSTPTGRTWLRSHTGGSVYKLTAGHRIRFTELSTTGTTCGRVHGP